MTVKSKELYHYKECGLDSVYLVNGFTITKTTHGNRVSIKDIEGLRKSIGRTLVQCKKDLNGKEIRFLRTEMLLSQSNLARLLEVSEQAVRRWETGKSEINKPTETIIRLLYTECILKENPKVKDMLKRISTLENGIAPSFRRGDNKDWRPDYIKMAS